MWVLLGADRRLVTAVPLLVVFASLVALGTLDPVPLSEAVAGGDPIETAFQAFIAAIVTGVTLVVTITQLVLSQELGAVGDQRERMAEAMDFREDVEAVLDTAVSPPEPSAFLRGLVEVARDRGEAFREAVGRSAEGELSARTDDFVDSLSQQAEAVSSRIQNAQFGTFAVLFAALDFDYSWKVYEARRLRSEHADELSEPAATALDELLEVLELFGPAREHIKTLYFQWELIDLSRSVLYASVPALIVAVGAVLYLDDPGTVAGATYGVDNLVWVASAGAAVALLPFAVLFSYVLRIATVAKRTLAIGPFILRESTRSDDIDWE